MGYMDLAALKSYIVLLVYTCVGIAMHQLYIWIIEVDKHIIRIYPQCFVKSTLPAWTVTHLTDPILKSPCYTMVLTYTRTGGFKRDYKLFLTTINASMAVQVMEPCNCIRPCCSYDSLTAFSL